MVSGTLWLLHRMIDKKEKLSTPTNNQIYGAPAHQPYHRTRNTQINVPMVVRRKKAQ